MHRFAGAEGKAAAFTPIEKRTRIETGSAMAAPYFFASRALTALALASLLLALPTFGNSKPGLERWIEDFEWTESGWRVNGWEVTQDVECDPNQCVMRTSRCIGEWLRHIPLPPEKKERKKKDPARHSS